MERAWALETDIRIRDPLFSAELCSCVLHLLPLNLKSFMCKTGITSTV